MNELIEQYKKHCTHLGEPHTGGTRVEHIETILPDFMDVMEIVKPKSILEIGFNAGNSALIFLVIKPEVDLHSIDIVMNEVSAYYLEREFYDFFIHIGNSKNAFELIGGGEFDLVFIDGDHSREGVIADIESALKFKPKYILFDDIRHPSHEYIEEIILNEYKDKLELVKIYQWDQIWEGYSMGLAKVK